MHDCCDWCSLVRCRRLKYSNSYYFEESYQVAVQYLLWKHLRHFVLGLNIILPYKSRDCRVQ